MRIRCLTDAVAIHVARFLVMLSTLYIAGWLGVDGWYRGFVVNVVVTIFAAVLMTRRGLWRATGMLTLWRSWVAILALVPILVESVSWALPAGLADQPPGFLLWGVSLLLVGANEEWVSRGVVLTSLRRGFQPPAAVITTGLLFGLQHLSAFALTNRTAGDILGNVALSAVVGIAYAAFQFRFSWLWPLILLHATADFTTILAQQPLANTALAIDHVLLLAYAALLMWWPARFWRSTGKEPTNPVVPTRPRP